MGVYERHPSVTEQAVSNTWKISLALFINSACVVLLVNLPNSFTVRREKTSAESGENLCNYSGRNGKIVSVGWPQGVCDCTARPFALILKIAVATM